MTIRLLGSTSGYTELDAPSVAGNNNLKLPTSNGSDGSILGTDGSGNMSWVNGRMVQGTAQASTSGTSIDFTDIPSWVKRITVMFDEVSMGSVPGFTSIQLGTSAGFTTSGYTSDIAAVINAAATAIFTVTTAFPVVNQNSATNAFRGHAVITKITGNTWVYSSNTFTDGTVRHCMGAGRVSLADTLTQIRIMETGGASFDAGTINILYEG